MLNTNLHNSIDFNGQSFYIGLDVHKKSWAVTIRSLNLELARFTQPPSAEALSNYLRKNFPGGQYYSAYEAGFCGTSNHEQLCKLGIKNILIHAADMPSTDKEKKNKTDMHDSRAIADYLERGKLKGIHVLTQEQQELRSLFRCREARVKEVTRVNNRLKGFLMYFDIKIPEDVSKKEHLSLKALAWLNFEMRSEAGTITLHELVEELKYQRKRLYEVTKQLRLQIQKDHADTYKYLLSVPGIGAVTAMALIAEIADFGRFDDPDEYCSFLGLCPWEDSSGETIKTKGMQPRCNQHLRPILIEASWTAVKKSPTLFAYYSKHAVKDSKKAIVKVARRLALIARGVALKQQLYQEDYLQKKKTEQNSQGKTSKRRFFSGITEQHINKQPDNVLSSWPG